MQVLENQNTADRENLEEANKTVSQLQARESEKSYELRACQENLHQAKQAEGNVMQGFPKWMPSLLRAIDNEPGFRQKPVGPLGMYITLKEQKWMGIIEKFLGTTLTSFVVTNYADGDLLKRIMDRVGFRVPYTVTAPKQLNMNEPAENYLTILRVLDIENESARIQLVVSHSAEQAILIEDLDEANQIMRHRRHQDNIQMCFSINKNHAGYGHKVGGGIGVSSVAPVPPFNGLSHMKSVNAGAQIERFQYDVQRIQMELHEIEREKGAAKQRVAQIKQSMDDFDRRIRNFRLQISQNEDRIESLQSRIEEINADGELNVLQERLRVRLFTAITFVPY